MNPPQPMFWPWQQPQTNQRPILPNEAPARVFVAIRYLNDLTAKTMTRVAVNDVGFQELDGQKLTPCEVEAGRAACEALTAYLKGRMTPDAWEDVILGEAEPREPEGQVMRCMACEGASNAPNQCSMCRGEGRVIVYPHSVE